MKVKATKGINRKCLKDFQKGGGDVLSLPLTFTVTFSLSCYVVHREVDLPNITMFMSYCMVPKLRLPLYNFYFNILRHLCL